VNSEDERSKDTLGVDGVSGFLGLLEEGWAMADKRVLEEGWAMADERVLEEGWAMADERVLFKELEV